MKINYNYTAMMAQNSLSVNDQKFSVSTGKLSSGKKIASAKDNPSGLAMSRRMNAQIKGMQEANKNAQNAINVVKTTDGALSEIQEMMQRMNELAVRAATDTLQPEDREYIQQEISSLKSEVQRVSETTQFNGLNLLDGTFGPKSYSTAGDGSNLAVKVLDYSGIKAENLVISGIAVEEKSVTTRETKVAGAEVLGIDFDNSKLGPFTIYDSAGNLIAENSVGGGYGEGAGDYTYSVSVLGNWVHQHFTPTHDIKPDELVQIGDYQVKGFQITFLWGAGTEETEKTVSMTTLPNTERNDAYDDGAKQMEASSLNLDNFSVVDKDDPEGKNLFTNPVGRVHGDLVEITDDSGKSITFQIDQTMNGDEQIDLELPYNRKLAGENTTRYGMTAQIGSNEGSYLNAVIPDVSMTSLGIRFVDASTETYARESIDDIQEGLRRITRIRSDLGAMQNRLEHTVTNLNTTEENTTSSYSTMMDTDMAEEMIEYSTYQILTQTGVSMLAQANQRAADMLQLIQ